MADWVNLGALVDEMRRAPSEGPRQLALRGGEFSADRLSAFISAWHLPRAAMPWSLWLWTDDITVGHGAYAPEEVGYIERGHIFGDEGDLELRRDHDRVLWRFVGRPHVVLPEGFDSEDYWTATSTTDLRPYERTALLWGKSTGRDAWGDNRVGWAHLRYPPGLGGCERVQLCYREYLNGGAVEAVWLLRLESASPNEVTENA